MGGNDSRNADSVISHEGVDYFVEPASECMHLLSDVRPPQSR